VSRNGLIPALDDLSHTDAERGRLVTVEAGVERGVLAPDHTMVVDGDGVSTADHRAIAFKELHDLQAGGSDLSREFDGRPIAEFGIDNRHFRCHGEPP